MANVFDVAQFVLTEAQEPITSVKLYLLLYYSQVWHSVWSDDPLFPENMYKTKRGVNIPELIPHIGDNFKLHSLPVGDVSALTDDEKDSVRQVLKLYNAQKTHWIKSLIQNEDPWKNTDIGEVLDLKTLYDYYSGL